MNWNAKELAAALLLAGTTALTVVSAETKNPADELFGEDLSLHIGFDDAKGKPMLMDGEISIDSAKSTACEFVEKGIFGKAFSAGTLVYNLQFRQVSFSNDSSIAFWISLMSDNPELDKKSQIPIMLQSSGPAVLMIQRQGWEKACNLLSNFYIPGTKGPLARIFNVAKTSQWKVGEWHMVTVSWTPENFSIALDDGDSPEKYVQVALSAPIPVLCRAKQAGTIKSMRIELKKDTLSIDEIMFFRKKLSRTEIKKLYAESMKGSAQKMR